MIFVHEHVQQHIGKTNLKFYHERNRKKRSCACVYSNSININLFYTSNDMKTLMNEKSLDAYDSIKDELGDKQQKVLETVITLGMATNRMISQSLGWEINRVTGRVNELVNKGILVTAGDYLDPSTSRTVNMWKYAKS